MTLQGGLPDGTLIRYYCALHKGAEATPNGTITIVAAQPPAPGVHRLEVAPEPDRVPPEGVHVPEHEADGVVELVRDARHQPAQRRQPLAASGRLVCTGGHRF